MNNNKVKKIMMSLALIIALLLINVIGVNAATQTHPMGVGKYTRSVKRISWWMSYDNGGGWYEYQINNAINNWENPGWSNPLHFVESDNNRGTMMDVYTKTSSFWTSQGKSAYTLATTAWYNGSGNPVSPDTKNYYFTRIYINDTEMHNFTANNIKGTIAHEIGHTLGLDHNNYNQYSIMCQTGSGRLVQTVQKTDNDAVVNFYS